MAVKTCLKCNTTKTLCLNGKTKAYRCIPCRKLQNNEYVNRPEIRIKINKKALKYYHKSKESKKLLEKKKAYRQDPKNKEKIREYNKAYRAKQYKNNPLYKLSLNLRNRLNRALERNSKVGSAVRDLGCSLEDFKKYLESKFELGMNWQNHSVKGWHIDHITPLCEFDLTDKKEFLKAVHYTNLQPLWSKQNWKKNRFLNNG